MNETTITCPQCGADIPLTEAVSHRLREQLEADFEKRRRELNDAVAERERKLREASEALEKRREEIDRLVAEQVERVRKAAVEKAAAEAGEKFATEIKDLRNEIETRQKQLEEIRNTELQLRKRQRELEETARNQELELARRLDAERTKIADEASKRAAEAERLKLGEKEQIIKGLQEQIAALKQRAEQGSMQIQGETLEITLEQDLRDAFRHDEIIEVKKGQRGADVCQRVRTATGLDCGAILWEAKSAKNWSDAWVGKLKEDQRAEGAEIAILVSTTLPGAGRGIREIDGVWACEPPFAIALAAALRHGLIATAAQRLQDTDRTSKTAVLYDHICSVGFRQHVQAIVETFLGLQNQLAAEQRAFARQWKERESQIKKAILHTAELYGGIQGIAGREALPEIEALRLPGAD